MLFRSLVGAACAVILVLPAACQIPRPNEPPTFGQFLAKMPWDAAKQGPLVAVEPLVMRRGDGLAAFNSKTVAVGGLTAVVPLRMTIVDSKIKEPPNFYEGLPQDDKILYLLASLSPDQWGKAATEGIAMADCHGEQALVFDSILPNPFRYSLGTVLDERGIQGSDKPEDKHSLTGTAREGIRLRIVRHLELTLALKNDRGYTGGDVDDGRKKGDRVAFVEQEDAKKAFGHAFLVDGPNLPRPSQLDLRDARLGATVPLKKGDTVETLLERIALATGVRVVPDAHYARMPTIEVGEAATARDLLGAVALGVAGTFRRIGDAYVLTNDLEGMAAHQARIAAFVDAAKKEVDEREKGWRKAVVLSGGFRKIAFHGAAYEGLTEAERTNLESSDRISQGNNPYIPVGQTSPAVRAGLMRGAQGLEIDKEKVSLRSSVRCEIVLPDGSTTWWANWLGSADEFTDKPYEPNRSRPPVALPLAATPRLAGLVLHADTPAEARTRVERAARLGVPAVWLETLNPDALAAAIAAGEAKGIKVSLALRPWAVSTASDPDRTATGAHGKSLAAQKADLGPWNAYWNDAAYFQPVTRERLAPLDPAVSTRTSALAGLTATKGLASVALLDLYGTGYAKASGNSYGDYYYSPPIDNFLAYGYTDAQRTAFFRQEGIDPLDVENPMLNNQGVELRGAWGDAWVNDDAFAKWQKARGAWAHDAARRLARAFSASGRPVLLGFQPPVTNVAPFLGRYLTSWDPSGDVPVAPEDFGGTEVEKVSAFKIIELQDGGEAEFVNRVAWVVSKHLAAQGTPVVLDFSSVPSARLETVLARWLKERRP